MDMGGGLGRVEMFTRKHISSPHHSLAVAVHVAKCALEGAVFAATTAVFDDKRAVFVASAASTTASTAKLWVFSTDLVYN